MKSEESFGAKLREFFYAEEVPYALAIIRICLPMILAGLVLPRWVVCRELYSADGATAQLSAGYGYFDLLPEMSGTAVAGLYAVMLFSLLTLCIGFCTRASALITFVLFTYFTCLDCCSTMTKYTVICSHLFLILSLSQCGAIWSVDAWLANRRRSLDPTRPAFEYPRFAAWPRRLIQIHIAVVYFGAAMTKIHTPTFFSGDQLQYWMLTHLNYKHPIGEFLSLYPILLVVFGYIVVVWEIVFLFCAWKGSLRHIILPIGILFHFMTTLTLGLLMFPTVCYSTYLAFMDEDDVQRMSAWVRRQGRRFAWVKTALARVNEWQASLTGHPEWRLQSRVAFLFSLVIVAAAGIELEYSWDIYNERGPDGKQKLVAIDPERARQLLAPVAPQRDIDKFFSVDLGTIFVGDLIADRRTTFRQGERMIAQCNLTPPHEDMAIQCKIRDSENRTVKRIIGIGTREMFRVNIEFPIPESLAPGEYYMTIETAGRHVMKKKFNVVPKSGSVVTRTVTEIKTASSD